MSVIGALPFETFHLYIHPLKGFCDIPEDILSQTGEVIKNGVLQSRAAYDIMISSKETRERDQEEAEKASFCFARAVDGRHSPHFCQ